MKVALKNSGKTGALTGACCAALLLVACGYHVGGKADLMPKAVQSIAVPAFTCLTTDYKLGDQLSNAIRHEFIERTRFHVVSDAGQADAVLTGTVSGVIRGPSLRHPPPGKTTAVQLVAVMSIALTQRSTGKVLFPRPSYVARENYAFATDPHQLFDESGPAAERLSLNMARDIVSAVVENF